MIISENDVKDKPIPIENSNQKVYYLKAIGIGPNTLKESGGVVYDIVSKIQGVFVVADKDEMRKTLHSIIDAACDDFERK